MKNEDINEVHNPVSGKITPLINEPVTLLNPETESQVSHLNSEKKEKKEKRKSKKKRKKEKRHSHLNSEEENVRKKQKKMGKEPNIDSKDPLPPENASPAKATLPVRDAEIIHRPKTDSEEIPRILQHSPERVYLTHFKKNLLILDLNGLLADIVQRVGLREFENLGPKAVSGERFYHESQGYIPCGMVGDKAVFKRPFCDQFLKFCFDNFEVAVWSSRTRYNKNKAVNLLLKMYERRLVFSWDRSRCTRTDFNTIDNIEKPLVLKELKNVWKEEWKKRRYNESDTLLVDDSPYKALRNPEHTAIFPSPYEYMDKADRSLSKDGDLHQYLQRLARTDNVRKFVEENPFGQRPITDTNLSWPFYKKVIDSVIEKERRQNSNYSNNRYRRFR